MLLSLRVRHKTLKENQFSVFLRAYLHHVRFTEVHREHDVPMTLQPDVSPLAFSSGETGEWSSGARARLWPQRAFIAAKRKQIAPQPLPSAARPILERRNNPGSSPKQSPSAFKRNNPLPQMPVIQSSIKMLMTSIHLPIPQHHLGEISAVTSLMLRVVLLH